MAAPAEPKPHAGAVRFEEGDFHALSEGLDRDRQFDDRRLVARRKLLSLGKQVAARAAAGGTDLLARSSLHSPATFNAMRVRRLWTYVARGKAEKARLRRTLGADLARDLDAAYRNAYLCLAIEAEALEVSLRIHAEAWYDGKNLARRVEAEGLDGWLALLNALPGFHLRLDDWKGEWACGRLDRDRLREFQKYYQPGTHGLAVEQRLPAPRGARGPAFEAGCAERMVEECLRLLPLYRFAAWSGESDFLFG